MINLIDRLKLPFRKDKELFSSLHSILGFYPHDISLYKQALSHSSLELRGKGGRGINNERLEFLGDAIIEAVTSDIVYRHFARKREGFLTTTRSKLVQRSTLNEVAREVGLDKLLRSDGHMSGHNNNMAGNAFEALVGAIYLDRGYARCKWFLERRIISGLMNIDKVARKEQNFKSRLLEWTQRNRLIVKLIDNDPGRDAATSSTPAFHCTVKLEGVECGKGDGFSKKESQQNAARDTLLMLNRDRSLLAAILKAKETRTAMEAELVSVPPRVSDEDARPRRKRRKNASPRRAESSAEVAERSRQASDARRDAANASRAKQMKVPVDGIAPESGEPANQDGEDRTGRPRRSRRRSSAKAKAQETAAEASATQAVTAPAAEQSSAETPAPEKPQTEAPAAAKPAEKAEAEAAAGQPKPQPAEDAAQPQPQAAAADTPQAQGGQPAARPRQNRRRPQPRKAGGEEAAFESHGEGESRSSERDAIIAAAENAAYDEGE